MWGKYSAPLSWQYQMTITLTCNIVSISHLYWIIQFLLTVSTAMSMLNCISSVLIHSLFPSNDRMNILLQFSLWSLLVCLQVCTHTCVYNYVPVRAHVRTHTRNPVNSQHWATCTGHKDIWFHTGKKGRLSKIKLTCRKLLLPFLW